MCGTSHSRMDNIDISSNNKFIAISENKEDGRSKFLDFLDNNEGSSVKDLNHKIFDDGYQFYNMNSNRDERGDPIYKEKYRPLENYFEIQFIEKNIEVFKEDFGLSDALKIEYRLVFSHHTSNKYKIEDFTKGGFMTSLSKNLVQSQTLFKKSNKIHRDHQTPNQIPESPHKTKNNNYGSKSTLPPSSKSRGPKHHLRKLRKRLQPQKSLLEASQVDLTSEAPIEPTIAHQLTQSEHFLSDNNQPELDPAEPSQSILSEKHHLTRIETIGQDLNDSFTILGGGEDLLFFTEFKKGQDLHIDMTFPPVWSSIVGSCRVFDVIKDEVKFLRVNEIFEEKLSSYIIENCEGNSVNGFQVYPNYFGNFMFCICVMMINEERTILKKILNNKVLNDKGLYSFNLFIDHKWEAVEIDDTLPVFKELMIFCSCNSIEIWPILLEKAYCKVKGSYLDASRNHDVEDIMFTLTGFPSQKFFLEKDCSSLGLEDHLGFLRKRLKEKDIVLLKTRNSFRGARGHVTGRSGRNSGRRNMLLKGNFGEGENGVVEEEDPCKNLKPNHYYFIKEVKKLISYKVIVYDPFCLRYQGYKSKVNRPSQGYKHILLTPEAYKRCISHVLVTYHIPISQRYSVKKINPKINRNLLFNFIPLSDGPYFIGMSIDSNNSHQIAAKPPKNAPRDLIDEPAELTDLEQERARIFNSVSVKQDLERELVSEEHNTSIKTDALERPIFRRSLSMERGFKNAITQNLRAVNLNKHEANNYVRKNLFLTRERDDEVVKGAAGSGYKTWVRIDLEEYYSYYVFGNLGEDCQNREVVIWSIGAKSILFDSMIMNDRNLVKIRNCLVDLVRRDRPKVIKLKDGVIKVKFMYYSFGFAVFYVENKTASSKSVEVQLRDGDNLCSVWPTTMTNGSHFLDLHTDFYEVVIFASSKDYFKGNVKIIMRHLGRGMRGGYGPTQLTRNKIQQIHSIQTIIPKKRFLSKLKKSKLPATPDLKESGS